MQRNEEDGDDAKGEAAAAALEKGGRRRENLKMFFFCFVYVSVLSEFRRAHAIVCPSRVLDRSWCARRAERRKEGRVRGCVGGMVHSACLMTLRIGTCISGKDAEPRESGRRVAKRVIKIKSALQITSEKGGHGDCV